MSLKNTAEPANSPLHRKICRGFVDLDAKTSKYRLGLTTIEKALSTSGARVLGLYIYSASVMLQRSQTLRPEYRKIMGHVIGTPAIVSEMPGISQTELAQLLSCERATAGLQVAECVRKGWIRRVVSASDKRRYELQLTPKGERMLAEVRTIIARHEAEFLASLSQEERESLRRLLAKLIS
jgi:DNA-binding MarR family transcriptional regulator